MPFLSTGEEERSFSPFLLALKSDRERVLSEAMAALTPRQRELVELRYQRGATLEEIAQKWGVSKAAVSRMHQRTLHALQAHLARKRIAGLDQI